MTMSSSNGYQDSVGYKDNVDEENRPPPVPSNETDGKKKRKENVGNVDDVDDGAHDHHHSLPSVEDAKISAETAHNLYSIDRKKERLRKYSYVVIVFIGLLCVITLGMSISIATKHNRNEGKHDSSSSSTSTSTSSSSTVASRPGMGHRGQSRLDDVIAFLQDDFSSRNDLLHASRNPTASDANTDSPQRAAAVWMADIDPLHLPIPASPSYEDAFRFVQRYTLAVLYYALHGDSNRWILTYDFLTEKHECDWNHVFRTGAEEEEEDPTSSLIYAVGVRCNDDQEVVSLFMPGNGLEGNIPEEISLLQALNHVSLYSNVIGGTLPSRMQFLTDLTFLALEDNAIGGPIPEWISGLTNLTYLALGGNHLSGIIPTQLEDLTNLREVALESNLLTGTIDTFNRIPTLERLYLQENDFHGNIGHEFLQDCTNLRELDLSDNQFTGYIPHRFIQEFTILDVSLNHLGGTIPDPQHHHSPLQYLMCHNNQITGSLPTTIHRLSQLTHFDISNNNIEASIPDTLGDMSQMKYLYLSGNDFLTGHMPDFSALVNLKQLSMRETRRNGAIPYWMGESLTTLSLLDLGNNYLSGEIPDSLGNLEHVRFLLLNRNQLEGSIPETFVNLERLEMFLIDHNRLVGNANVLCSRDGDAVGMVDVFISDCGPNNSDKFSCLCCNLCCDVGDDSCNQNDVLSNQELSWKDGYPLNQVVFSEDIIFFEQGKGKRNDNYVNEDNTGGSGR